MLKTRRRQVRATEPGTRFTFDEYMRMAEANVFGTEKVELLNGRVYWMHSQGNPHRVHITLMNIILNRFFNDPKKDWLVVQGTHRLDEFNAPDPDFTVYDVPVGTPDDELPTPILIVEVSNKTYKRDSGMKLRKYAKADVPEYWIVNVKERRLEVYRKPINPTGDEKDCRYEDVQMLTRGQTLTLLKRPEAVVAVNEVIAEERGHDRK
ncbi:MAG: Uma2 family endonuclease [Tepidisphaeraceae bacterium]